MFNKKTCKKCGRKIEKNYDFCPFCGNRFYDDKDWGMLGKNDFTPSNTEIKLPMPFNTIFNSLVKNLSKEFDGQFKDLNKGIGKEIPKKKFRNSGGISINISSSGNKAPIIKVKSFGNIPKFNQREEEIKEDIKKIKPKEFSKEKMKQFSSLQRTEPSTNIRRLSNKVIYEINMPGVKSINNISIIQLENSIEIKAIGKNKAYFKLIPISLPIINSKISKEKLVLELEAK